MTARIARAALAAACLAAVATTTPALAQGPELRAVTAAEGAGTQSAKAPAPPRLPRNFDGKGRYIVRDLDVDVPVTWRGTGGDSQMIAGGERYPIHFTNIISDGYLYTLTYKWPGIARRPCSRVGPFTLGELNKFLASSRYVGAETLDDAKPRHVHHFRAGVVWEPPPEVLPPDLITPVGGTADAGEGQPTLRLPLMSGDFYVDQEDPTTFWKVLHFGLQNLYDPELDEWMVLDTFSHRAGKVTLPEECAAAAASPAPGAP
jgi:hypothetical protein